MLIRLAPIVFVCLWATGFVGARFAMPYAEPASFLTSRYLLALIVLAAICLIAKAPWPKGWSAIHAMVIGLLVHGVYLGGVFWAVRNGMPGGIAAIIVGLQPLLTAWLASIWLKDEISRWHWIGIAMGLVGISLVLLPGFDFTSSGINAITTSACLISVVGMTLGTLMQKRYVIDTADLRTNTALQYVGALAPTILFAMAFEDFQIEWNTDTVFALFWLVLVLSIFAIFLLMWLIRQGSVAQVSSLFYLVPAVAALMTWILFDEALTPIQIIGMVICTIAVALASKKPKVAA